ncbi:MAG TPA: hypothetical protein PKH54_00035 [Myxococcota bacterium]|nr:hypothetical protein [Myxococcota bacterium]HOC98302.1 hypothetical protein [Myxococcota bacterium]HOH77401.1 hypothetical protein [Myxococcota bacterium]
MEATAGWAIDFIRKIVARAPLRPPASPGELVAQQMVEDELKAIGLQTSWHRFRFHRSIYGNFALHFGLAVAATAVSPWCPIGAAVVHALVAFSYAMQSTRRHSVLSRLYFRRPSQNLLAVMPAEGGRPAIAAPGLHGARRRRFQRACLQSGIRSLDHEFKGSVQALDCPCDVGDRGDGGV